MRTADTCRFPLTSGREVQLRWRAPGWVWPNRLLAYVDEIRGHLRPLLQLDTLFWGIDCISNGGGPTQSVMFTVLV